MRDKVKNKLAADISAHLNLPKDLILGDPIVTITGRREITVENYRGILNYETVLIRLSLKHGQVEIHGSNLKIDYYTNDEMKISGRIDKIEYSI